MHADLIGFQAEGGDSHTTPVVATIGTEYLSGSDVSALEGGYLVTTTGTSNANFPNSENRTISYQINFPAAGTYDVYARVYVDGGDTNDSFFYASDFGDADPVLGGDWYTVNDLANDKGPLRINTNEYVWVNLTEFAWTETAVSPLTVTTPGTLAWEVGAREGGFRIDAFAFGTTGEVFTDAELTAATLATLDEAGPEIDNLFPIDGDTGVAPFSNLIVTFDEVVVAVPGSDIRIFESTDPINPVETIWVEDTAKVTVDGTTVTINPGSNLTLNTTYFVEIDSGAFEDIVANPFTGISGSGTWSFTTQPTAPAIDTLSPANGATDIALDSNLVITFDTSVALGSTGSITIRDASDDSVIEAVDVTSGNVTVTAAAEVTIDPAGSLLAGADCYVRIDPGAIEDTSGNAFLGIADSATWTFSTVPPPPSYLIYSQSFDNTDAPANAPIGPTGWKSNRGADNTASDPTDTIIDSEGIVIGSLTGGGGYDGPGTPTAEGYLFAEGNLGIDRQIYWTEQNVGDISEIAYFEVDLRNSSSSEGLRLALRIGSDWYVARPTSSTETSQGSTWTDNIQIDPDTLEFAALSFTAGGGPVIAGLDPLEPDATTVSLPTSGTVTAFGFYNTTTNANARIDNFEVYSYVEPTVDTFSTWIGGFGLPGDQLGFKDDPDNDGVVNGIEALFGTDPSVGTRGLTEVSKGASTVTFQHPNPDAALSDVGGSYEWSSDMTTWYAADNTEGDGSTTVDAVPTADSPVANTTTVVATINGTVPARIFLRAVATQNP